GHHQHQRQPAGHPQCSHRFGRCRGHRCKCGRSYLEGTAGIGDIDAVCNGQICGCSDAGRRAKAALNNKKGRASLMQILQPAEWKKPRGFSHGVVAEGPGRWVVLAGQTGGDETGDYAPDMAAQVATALKRIIKLLGEAGAGPEHIVRLTWYLTSRSEYEAAGAGIG